MSPDISKLNLNPHVLPVAQSQDQLRNPLESVFLSDMVILEYNTKHHTARQNRGKELWKSGWLVALVGVTLVAACSGLVSLLATGYPIPVRTIAWTLAVMLTIALTASGGFLAWATHELGTP